jgi:acyl-CoA hydrolase/RimJ/RimL family protein N-acetyltransferase
MECKAESREIREMRKAYPGKFESEEKIFSRIHGGDRIFVGTGCGEPQYLVRALVNYVESNPKAFTDAEVVHVWTLGVAPYASERFRFNFRHNSFFIGTNTRQAVNAGAADYTPVFLSQVPSLFHRRLIPVDVALIQTSPPDIHGYMSLGVSLDIVKTACEVAPLVIAQINENMPRVHGDGFIHIEDIDYLVSCDEPLLEYETEVPDEIADRIGKYVARIVEDGDTIQVGYGSLPIAILSNLYGKHDLGVHTELLSDGIVDLMRKGVVTNRRKNIDTGKTVATFCMGRKETYEYIDDNPTIEFKTIDYTNNPLVIAQIRNMTAINSVLEIDLTGQATSESIGTLFYSGVGGQADFMRGAAFAPGGKTILVMPSTAQHGTVSRIVPFLKEGAGITTTRGDVQYVVTEYGIAYLSGRNVRERSMALIAVAHPDFRPWLVEQAKKRNLVYKDQAFVSGEKGVYPEHLETCRTTKTGMEVLLRPVKITDEGLLKDFFYDLSIDSMYRRFMSWRFDMTHERLQEYFTPIDYTKEMVILATIRDRGIEKVIGVGQYIMNTDQHTAEVAVVVMDFYQNRGVGYEILAYLIWIAQRRGLLGFTAEVLVQNEPMLHLFEKMGFDIHRTMSAGVYELTMRFKPEETEKAKAKR